MHRRTCYTKWHAIGMLRVALDTSKHCEWITHAKKQEMTRVQPQAKCSANITCKQKYMQLHIDELLKSADHHQLYMSSNNRPYYVSVEYLEMVREQGLQGRVQSHWDLGGEQWRAKSHWCTVQLEGSQRRGMMLLQQRQQPWLSRHRRTSQLRSKRTKPLHDTNMRTCAH